MFWKQDSKVKPCKLCLANISKDLQLITWKSGLNGNVYDYCVNYITINISDIVYIHKYLMKKINIKKMFKFIK